jgi:hypothetical protein
MLKAVAVAQRSLTEAIARRTGTDPDRDMYPRLVAAAVGAAWQVVTDRWANADPPVPMAPLMREALTLLAAGLPDPTV